MFNVDTLTIGMNLEDKLKSYINLHGEINMTIDYRYIKKIEKKLKEKLYLDSNNRKMLLQKQQRKKTIIDVMEEMNHKNSKKDCIYWFGQDNGFGFCYNETRHVLSVTLSHYNVEKYTAEEIIGNVTNKVTSYFDINETDILPFTLRRIDYYCDYRYKDETELLAIKQVISKATETVYSYKREITDKPESYVVKYLSLKKNTTDTENPKLTISKKTVIDKEWYLDET